MIVLGLGSNLSDRLHYLRKAYKAIEKISFLKVVRASPLYRSDALLPDQAPAAWDMPYLNLALLCTTTLSPFELLDQIKNIEDTLGRKFEEKWGPRVIDIDLLAFDDLVIKDKKLILPHAQLHKRPFAIWPFADVAPFLDFSYKRNFPREMCRRNSGFFWFTFFRNGFV